MNTLPNCKTMQELEKKLLSQGIETHYKYKGQTLEKQGVSFKTGEDCFKGSQVDRQFSLGNLEKTLAFNQKQLLELKAESGVNSKNMLLTKEKQTEYTLGNTDNSHTDDTGKGLEKIVEILLKPEENIQQTPYELLKEERQKRKNYPETGECVINIKTINYERNIIRYCD